MGELAESALFMKHIRQSFYAIESNNLKGADYTIYCPPKSVSKVVGQKKCNIKQIQNEFNVNNIKIIETDTIEGYNIIVMPAGQTQ